MTVTPIILGSGRSGDAIAKSLAILGLQQPELKLGAPVWLERGASLTQERMKHPHPVLCIANPHGLHAEALLEADQAGYDAILCEKPACVSREQIADLRAMRTATAVFHGYRQMWGVQTLRQMLDEQRFGELIAIEGRYWQASTAERALLKVEDAPAKGWKDDPRLSGMFDVYLDIGTHLIDAMSFLYGSPPSRIRAWRSYVNAVSPHRDSHIHIAMDYPQGGRALGSVSKSIHGAGNHFELNVIGSKLAATWQFLQPDEILVGEGRERRVLMRGENRLGGKLPPFHGMGWLDGYVEISARLLREVYLGERSSYPRLKDNLELLDAMFQAEWEN